MSMLFTPLLILAAKKGLSSKFDDNDRRSGDWEDREYISSCKKHEPGDPMVTVMRT